jgi:hypothetical protein
VRRALGVGALLLSCACDRPSQDGTPGAAPSVAAASASPSPIASAAPSASAAPTAALQTWHGSYKTTPGTLAVPADWSKTHWSSSDTATGVGEGALQLTVDPVTRRVSGTVDGAIGAAVVEGMLSDAQLSAAVRRKDPTDRGLAGTLVATVATDKVTGTMTLASGDGATLRAGTFTLTPVGP